MRYSLLNRFEGTLLGAVIGENAAPIVTWHQKAKRQEGKSLHWSNLAIKLAESLISQGRVNVSSWQNNEQEQEIYLKKSLSFILACLPVALYYHENLVKLRQNLELVTETWQCEPAIRDGTLVVGYALAQSLTEKISRSTLICQTVSFLGDTQSYLPQQLLKVNDLLEKGFGLERVQTELDKEEKLENAIAIAFYYFLSTLEDFRLSILRSHQNASSEIVSALVGALSGAYNSKIDIPVAWQISLKHLALTECNLTNSLNMLRLTPQLFAVWSGVYDIACEAHECTKEKCVTGQISSLQAVAAPRVIR